MKPKVIFAHVGGLLAVYLCAITLASGAAPVSTSINFTLDEPCVTSAGVFSTNGTLIRTLWSKIRFYAAGTYSTNWNGLDDYGNPAPAGVYEFKLLQHNMEYVWDGAIGNTSAEQSGPTVYQGFYAMQDMAITGTNAFIVSGYNEGKYPFRSFNTASPQYVANQFYWDLNPWGQIVNSPGSWCRGWFCATTDGNWVYFGGSSTYSPINLNEYGYPGCVVACNTSNDSLAYFTTGTAITNAPGDSMPNGIYVGTQPGLCGLSVQRNGNLLAAAVAPDNTVYLMDKHSGAVINSLRINSPGRLNFSPDGSLWVIAGNEIIQYTNLPANPSMAQTISGLSQPLDVAVNPTNPNLVLVADGGGSQQIKAFNSVGIPLWIYGLAGGYPSNGVAVTTNKFWFSYEGVAQTFLCFAPDGSFWVGDEENHRAMHFSAARNYLENIMYQPHSYRTAVDLKNPNRVFNQFLEFNVDYTKPLSQAWTPVNNWKVNLTTNNINSSAEGLYQVTDFPNGRTYALIDYWPGSGPNAQELCELTTNQIRLTGLFPLASFTNGWVSFETNGTAYLTQINSARWYEATLKGFDTNNNPLWNPPQLIASAPNGNTNPVPRCCSGDIYTAISTNNIIISYDSTLTSGSHFGGVLLGSTNWLWQAGLPRNMNPANYGNGNYEISNGITYGGNIAYAAGRNVYFGFHGEFFRSQGEAAQGFHFLDDGLLVGQFGEASNGHSVNEGALPAFAGNGYNPDFIQATNGEYYAWINDESDHGPQRWHFVNARNIREQVGFCSTGGMINLTNGPTSFPVALSVINGSNSVKAFWAPVDEATNYTIYYSTNNGGPYDMVLGTSVNTNFYKSEPELANGTNYYLVVTATADGVEGIPSEQIEFNPFDTSRAVLPWGTLTEGGGVTPVDDVNSNAVASSQPSLIGSEHLTALLTPEELVDFGYGNLQTTKIGTQGYFLFDWGGPGTNASCLSTNFTVSEGSAWTHCQFLGRQYNLNGIVGTNLGLMANPIGTINIGVSDDNFHVLTVICPAKFTDARTFNLDLASTSYPNMSFTNFMNEAYGLNHTFQYLFKGNVTLTANATGGNEGIVQALFFDNVPVAIQPPQHPQVERQ